MFEDANTISGFAYNVAVEFTGGDWVFVGLVVLILLIFVLALAKVRSGGIVAVGSVFFFILGIFNPIFMVMFWIALVISMFILVNGIRKKITGQ